MASTYTTNLGIEKPGAGEQDGTWGGTLNADFDMYDEAVVGIATITLGATGSTGSPNTETITNDGTSNAIRHKYVIVADSGDLGGDVYLQLAPDTAQKTGYIENALTGTDALHVFQGDHDSGREYIIQHNHTALVKFSGAGTSSSTVTSLLGDIQINSALLENAETISWRDNAGTGTVTLTVNSSDVMTCSGALTCGAFTSTGIDDNATSTAITISSAEDVTMELGDVVMATSGKGVDFSAVANSSATGASTTGEILTAYAKGTYTPTLTCSSSGSYTIGGGQTTLSYVVIGDLCHIQGRLQITGESSPSGTLRLELPFTVGALTENADTFYTPFVIYNAGSAINYPLLSFVGGQTYTSLFYTHVSGDPQALTDSLVDTAFFVAVQFSYVIA